MDAESKVEMFTEQAIQRLRRRYEENMEKALSEIITQVLTVSPQSHGSAENPC